MCSAIKHEMFCFEVLHDEEEHTSHSDLIGRFPIEWYTGGNADGELPCRSKDDSDGSIVTRQQPQRWSVVALQELVVMAESLRVSSGASDGLLHPDQQSVLLHPIVSQGGGW